MIDSKTAQELRELAERTTGEEFKMILLDQLEGITAEKDNATVSSPDLEEKDNSQKIAAIFRELGITANIKGYKYLMEAIIYCIGKGNVAYSITKDVYPAVAKKFDTTPSRVERSIRHAIEVCYDKSGDSELFKKYFGNIGRPKNSEFICGLANWIKLGM